MASSQPAATAPARILELDGLRGLAVSMVVVAHFCITQVSPRANWSWLDPLIAFCDPGVDIFFVLSGFLIGGILLRESGRGLTPKSFYVRRGFRILPVYWMLLLSFVVIQLADLRARFGLIEYYSFAHPFWHYLLFLQNNTMAARQEWGAAWLAVTWSLAVEEQFYLFVPWIVGRVSRRTVGALCVAAIVACPLIRFHAAAVAYNRLAAGVLLVGRADSLSFGVLLALVMESADGVRWLRRHRRWLVIASGAAVLVNLFRSPFDSTLTLTGAPSLYALGAACVLAHVVLHRGSRLAGILRWRPLVFMGTISYFVYLFHLPIYYIAVTAWPRLGHAGVCVVTAGLVLVAGAASMKWIEGPLLKMGRKLAGRYTSAVPASEPRTAWVDGEKWELGKVRKGGKLA